MALVLFQLLFQAQTVFACQMMDHSGPIENCCCDDMDFRDANVDTLEAHGICCDIGSELTIKDGDANKEKPILLLSQVSFDPPRTSFVVLLVTLWPDLQSLSSSPDWDFKADPKHSGSLTYLSTLRLRI